MEHQPIQATNDKLDTARVTSTGLVPMGSSLPPGDADDLWYPRAKLLQALSPEVDAGDGRPGQWHIEGHGPVAMVTIIPLRETCSRRLSEGEGDALLTLCASDDAVNGEGDPGGNCPVCPRSQWTTDSTGKRYGPACILTRTVFGYVPAIELPVRIDFKRTSEMAAKMIKTFTRVHGLGNVAVELGSVQKKSGSFNYYVPTVRMIQIEAAVLAQAQMLTGQSMETPIDLD